MSAFIIKKGIIKKENVFILLRCLPQGIFNMLPAGNIKYASRRAYLIGLPQGIYNMPPAGNI